MIRHTDPDSLLIRIVLKTLTQRPSLILVPTSEPGRVAARLLQAKLVREAKQSYLFPDDFRDIEITDAGRTFLAAGRTKAKWLRSKKRQALYTEWLASGDPLTPFHVHLKNLPKTQP